MDDVLGTSTPEAQGIPSAAVAAFAAAAEEAVDSLHSFVLVRHGHVVADGTWFPYSADRRHVMFSVTKSFTSSAVGFAVTEGLLSVDDPVASFFPDIVPEPSGNLAAMRVKHLLTMTTGHDEDTGFRMQRADGDWVRAFFGFPVEHEPGTHFVYNSGASHILSAIVQRLTGKNLLEYLTPRLFAPLGITDVAWDTCPMGINAGGWGLHLRVGDLARFGQLYLRNGEWQGRQLLPAEWVSEATQAHADNDSGSGSLDWRQGYGYQFWRSQRGAYRADGAFGQFCLIMPDQDAVLAITAGVADMQIVLDLVWEHLLPAMADAALPADETAHEALRHRLETLRQPAQSGSHATPAAVDGRTYVVAQPQRSRQLAAIEAFTLTTREGGWTVAIDDEEGSGEVECGDGEWRLGVLRKDDREGAVAASGGWTAEDTFVMRLALTDTPFVRTYEWRFEGDDAALTVTENVAFGPTDHPVVRAKAA